MLYFVFFITDCYKMWGEDLKVTDSWFSCLQRVESTVVFPQFWELPWEYSSLYCLSLVQLGSKPRKTASWKVLPVTQMRKPSAATEAGWHSPCEADCWGGVRVTVLPLSRTNAIPACTITVQIGDITQMTDTLLRESREAGPDNKSWRSGSCRWVGSHPGTAS